VQAHCEKLGTRFRFYSLGKWSGFKAGALNFALRETDPRAAVVGVIDADYVVQPYWLKAMLPGARCYPGTTTRSPRPSATTSPWAGCPGSPMRCT
jgi:cellulose synthase/poly-beta-1,6-N-acetylglucosamine synthase-like glycosyltransferase